MTPEERAEKICLDFSGQTFSSSREAQEWMTKAFAVQIREAVEEAYRIAIPQAKMYAYEDAAKIIKSKIGDCWDIPESLVSLVRARKDEVEK